MVADTNNDDGSNKQPQQPQTITINATTTTVIIITTTHTHNFFFILTHKCDFKAVAALLHIQVLDKGEDVVVLVLQHGRQLGEVGELEEKDGMGKWDCGCVGVSASKC